MKFILAVLSLICLILTHKSLAKPVDVDSNSVQLSDSRLAIPNINCIIQCVQPTGQESEDDDVQARGIGDIFQNYGNLFNCIKECSKK